jgi:hypothetical protein
MAKKGTKLVKIIARLVSCRRQLLLQENMKIQGFPEYMRQIRAKILGCQNFDI